MPVKVLMICPEFFPRMGGTEVQALNLSKALRQLGVEVTALTRQSVRGLPREETVQGVPVCRVEYPRVRLLGGVLLNVQLARQLWKRRHRTDLCHFHIGGSHMLLPFICSRLLGIPSLLKISGWWEMETGMLATRGMVPRLMRWLLFTVASMVAVSEEIRDRLLALGYPAERIFSLPNGVDLGRFCPVPRPPRPPRILFVGRLVPEKGLPILLQAAARLASRFPDLELRLAGEGHEEPALRQLADELGVADRVRFLGRLEEVAPALSESDIYVQPSLSEGLPNALLEAMASGLPAVVTSVGGMPDVVRDGVQGLVVSPGDVEGLARALATLLEDAGLRATMGEKASASAHRRFCLKAVAGRYLAHYQTLLG